MSLVTVHEAEQKQYTLLTPGLHLPRVGPTYQVQADYRDIPQIIEDASKSEILAVDFETKGGDYSDEIAIIGVGLAWDSGSVYLDWAQLFHESRNALASCILRHSGLIAHNIYFDGGVVLTQFGQHAQWKSCTYNLLASLANESPEQKWGLKHNMVSLLGWADANDTDLDEWLVVNGYYIGNRRVDNSTEYLRAEFQAGKLRADKGEMWRAPKEILGKYCVLDAEACYLLYTQVLWPVAQKFPGLVEHHQECLHSIKLHIEQKIHGIPVDRPGLIARRETVQAEASELEARFRSHPEVLGPIQEIEKDLMSELLEREPTLHTKKGLVSKNHSKWSERVAKAYAGEIPEYRFNLNSDPQLRKLFYQLLGHEIKQVTESLQPSTSTQALQRLGEAGRILADYNYAQKELGFLDGYLEMTERRPTIHPSFRTPGTVTGRLSSREPNLQQVPKSKAMMSLFKARPGTVWVDIDFAALEAVVAAEFSQDPNLLSLYGNGVPENDIHLFVASLVPGEMGDSIRKTGYRPTNPPPGTVSRAKKECKRWRSIAKTVVYACQFGAGIDKVMQQLEADGILLSRDEVALIHSTYWNTFAKLKDFGKGLEYEWRRNKGYILNGLGRPMAVSEDYRKDLLNRFIQSTGHDILVKYQRIFGEHLGNMDLEWKPLIWDWHDAVTVEVPEDRAEVVVATMNHSMNLLNAELSGSIKLKGVPVVGRNLAEVKEPES